MVIEGCSPIARQQALAAAVATGWQVVDGWSGAGPGIVCTGVIEDDNDAERAVMAAVAGAGLVVEATASRELRDRLCDDLRRLGPVDHRVGDPAAPALGDEERALLGLLLRGASLGDAARTLHLSRRTADRRLAAARRALGCSTTSEALVLARRIGLQ